MLGSVFTWFASGSVAASRAAAARGPKHGPYWYLRYQYWDAAAERDRYAREYVPRSELPRVRRWIRRAHQPNALAVVRQSGRIGLTLCRVKSVPRLGVAELLHDPVPNGNTGNRRTTPRGPLIRHRSVDCVDDLGRLAPHRDQTTWPFSTITQAGR